LKNPALSSAGQAGVLVAEIRARGAAEALAVLSAADAEAASILQGAREKARRQLARVRADLRATRRRRLMQVAAELETARRQRASAQSLRLLEQAAPRLAAELARRWREPSTRQRWIAMLLATAAARLRVHDWCVRHPEDLDSAGANGLRAQLARLGTVHADAVADRNLRTGLVIEGGGVRLDGTADALLADRASVAAALLAEIVAIEVSRASVAPHDDGLALPPRWLGDPASDAEGELR